MSSDTQTKKITLSGKYSKFLVFGHWLIQQINADEELTSKAQEQLQLFASPQQQNLFFETFFDDIKLHTNSMKNIIKLHNKPTPKTKTVNKPKPTNDNPKPKPKPKPKPNTKSQLVNDPQQALVDAIVNAAQTEIEGAPREGAPTVTPYPLPLEEEAYIKEVEVVETKKVEVVETKKVEVVETKKVEVVETKKVEVVETKKVELPAKKETKEEKKAELLAKKEAKETELLAKKEAKETELLAKKEAKETELLAKKEAKETELLAKKEAKETELLTKKQAKEAELLAKKNTKNTVKKLTKQNKNDVVVENENKNEANTIVTTIINTVIETALDTAIDNLCGNFGDIALEDDDDQETLNLRPIHFPDGSDFLLDELTNHLYDPNSIHDIDFTHVALYHNNTFNYIK
jgi:regulator of protease activity HflC (stomatin/prohibitin superfamily)